MLLLDIDHHGAQLVQGFVRCQWPASSNIRNEQAGAWIRLFVRSAMLWSQLRPMSSAIRISASPGQPLVTVHSFVTPKAQESRLRLMLAAFLRCAYTGGGQTAKAQPL